MFDKAFEYAKQLITLKSQVEKNTSDLNDLSNNVKELTALVRDLAESNRQLRTSFDHIKEMERQERDTIRKDFQFFQKEQEQKQEILLLKLKSIIQENKLHHLSQQKDLPQLPGNNDKSEIDDEDG
jgi:chromosome segregation ATPase